MEKLTLTLTLESPYTATGEPRTDLPTGEVLALDGERWANVFIKFILFSIVITDRGGIKILLTGIKRFAPLPTIIEDESTIF